MQCPAVPKCHVQVWCSAQVSRPILVVWRLGAGGSLTMHPRRIVGVFCHVRIMCLHVRSVGMQTCFHTLANCHFGFWFGRKRRVFCACCPVGVLGESQVSIFVVGTPKHDRWQLTRAVGLASVLGFQQDCMIFLFRFQHQGPFCIGHWCGPLS